jgi:hypothetical protein
MREYNSALHTEKLAWPFGAGLKEVLSRFLTVRRTLHSIVQVLL